MRFGELETVLSSRDTKLSILEPRISPDGRVLVFCMCPSGNFPPYSPGSDLYMMDLATRRYWPLAELNSDRAESWHSWSSNGRWLAFSSKRGNGLFSRPYIGYIDAGGRARKPILVPRRNPDFYDSLLKNYNVPELVKGPMTVDRERLRASVLQNSAGPEPAGAYQASPALPGPGE